MHQKLRLGLDRGAADWVWRSNRRRANIAGSVKRADGSAVRVLVSNISYEGCHPWCDGDLQKGELIGLCLNRMSVMQAQVRWVRGDGAGLKFITGDSVVDDRRARLGV